MIVRCNDIGIEMVIMIGEQFMRRFRVWVEEKVRIGARPVVEVLKGEEAGERMMMMIRRRQLITACGCGGVIMARNEPVIKEKLSSNKIIIIIISIFQEGC